MKSTLLASFSLIIIFLFSTNVKANTYTVTSNADDGTGTLRDAINQANSNPGTDSIVFNMLGTDVASRTITLLSELPQLLQRTFIDATTQPGNFFGISTSKVQLTATSFLAQGLFINADSCEVYGLFIQNFSDGITIDKGYNQIGALSKGNTIYNCSTAAIYVYSTNHIAIISNLIGVDTAQLVSSVVGTGVWIQDSYAVAIGGKSTDGRNVISGNFYGVNIDESQFIDMNANYIGTDMSGLVAIPNQYGVYATGNNYNIEIGGDSTYERNLISGNALAGIYGNFIASAIEANLIGTDVSGALPLGNGTYGIYLTAGSNTDKIGGTELPKRNIIAFNGNEAIYFQDTTCTLISVMRNLTFCNSKISGNGGFTFNGGNDSTAAPSILIASTNGVTGITYPNATVDIFFDDTCNHCEGDSIIGTVFANQAGVYKIETTEFTGTVTAVTTTVDGNSSEYATCTSATSSICIITNFVEPASGCAGTPSQFYDQTVTAPGTNLTTWTWTWGDGATSITPNPNHKYVTGGDYTITLTVTNSNNCSSSISKSFHVNNAPNAAFSSSSSGCVGASIGFQDLSTVVNGDSIISEEWDFGDGSTSSEQNPSHTFNQSGIFTVTLTVTGLSCTDVATSSIHIYDLPTANFNAPSLICRGNNVLFNDLSTAGSGDVLTTWQWNFGDGNSSSEQNPNHTYTTAGTYSVTLTVTGQSGCSDEYSTTIQIPDYPTTLYSAPATACVGNEVNFTDVSIAGAGDQITSWNWDFGDGNSSTQENPVHTFSSTGIFTVSLSVGTDAGCSGAYDTIITIVGPPTALFSSVTESCAGNEINFTDQSSANGDAIATWSWNFGDGNVSSLQSPTHSYSATGNYQVTLTITTTAGCTNQTFTNIDVVPQPVASFTFTQSGLNVSFTNTSTDNGQASYSWDFGDGGTSTEENPSHNYSSGGVYNVCLTVYDSICMTSVTQCNTVDLPTAINEVNGNSILIFPNPANNVVSVSGLSGTGAEKIFIINAIGQRILNYDIPSDASEMKLNVASLAEGVYILSLQKDDYSILQTRINVIH